MKQLAYIIEELSHNKGVMLELFRDVPREVFTWKQAPDKWCLLEIVCHLYDEECEDFRARIRHVLETPDEPLPAIDPQGWVTLRNYMQQNYDMMLNKFLAEREDSIVWLKSLSSPDWTRAYNHPKFGSMSAELFLVNWLAHDHLHIRQITRLKYDYLKAHSQVQLNYAGDWQVPG